MKATKNRYRLLGLILLSIGGLWLLGTYALPLLLPFLLGLAVAWMAEPLARVLSAQGRLPRAAATGLAITGVYLLLIGLVYLLIRLALGELDTLFRQLPAAVDGLDQVAGQIQSWLNRLARRAPERLRPGLEASISQLFSNGAALAEGAAAQIWDIASRLLLSLPDVFVFLGTAVASSFLISARLPRLRPWLLKRLPEPWAKRVVPALQNLRVNLGGWLRAQCKLMVLTFVALTLGFMVLRIPHAPLLGALIALVDALPMLGTGTVLVPWGILAMLQGDTALGFGLIAMYVFTALTRSVLEPRMLGRQLGLNPLITLAALYVGYQLWGILGMILAPVLTITAMELWAMAQREQTG